MKVYNGPLEYSWQLQRSFWPSDNENEVTESNGKPQKMANNGLKSTFFAKKSVFLGTGWGVSCIMVVDPRAVFGGVWGCFRVSICVLGCRITLFHPWNCLVRTLRMPKIAKKNRKFDQKFKSAFSCVESKNRVKNAFSDHFWPFLTIFRPVYGSNMHGRAQSLWS